MKRANTTYSTRVRNARIRRNRREEFARVSKPKTNKTRLMPWWLPAAVSVFLVAMLTATVNFRAYMDLRNEEKQNLELNQRVQQMTEENLGLQEEIYYLKNDTNTIEREAKKFGLVRPQKQVSRAGEIDTAEESMNRQTPTRK